MIPTHNRRPILLATLACLEAQSVPADRYEVIVSVDGSTDGTLEALSRLRPRYALRWVGGQHRGSAAARNAGARLAVNDVVIFLDDDQLASPDLVAAHLAAHERLGTVLVQGDYPPVPDVPAGGASLAYERSRRYVIEGVRQTAPRTWHVWGGNVSVRRATWAQIGGYDESFRRKQDTDFGLRIAALGVPFVFEPRASSNHLHECSYQSFRSQSMDEGQALVRLARKHRVPLSAFSGGVIGRADRVLLAGWSMVPAIMGMLGSLLLLGLRVTDRLGFKDAQLLTARLVRRTYLLAGICSQERRPHALRAERAQAKAGWRPQ